MISVPLIRAKLIAKFENTLLLWSFAKDYKRDIGLAMSFILLATFCILYIGTLVSDLTVALSNGASTERVLQNSGLIFFGVLLTSAAIFGRIYFFGRLGAKLIKNLRDALFKHLLKQDMFFFESQRAGEMVSRIMSDTNVIQLIFISCASSVLRNVILLFGSCTMMITLSPPLFALVSIASITLFLPSMYFGRKIRHLSKITQNNSADISAIVEETFNSISTSRANNFEVLCNTSFKEATFKTCSVICRSIIYFGFSVSFTTIMSFSILIGAVTIAYVNPNLHNLSLADFSAFSYYAAIAGFTLTRFNGLIVNFYRASGCSDRIKELFATLPSVKELPQTKSLSDKKDNQDLLVFQKLSFAYPSHEEKNVLDTVSFTLKKGEKVGLVGVSGAGKSTVFKLIQRFYDPITGHIEFNGLNLKELSFDEFRSQIALVEQDPFIFSTSVEKNIRMGNEDASFEDIERVARLSYCSEFIEALPQKYDTYVGEKGVRLSGGQKQRLAIGRAILRNPQLLLLDEATSSLDSESEYFIKTALDTFMQDRTSLIIAHRLSTVKDCDRILLLDNGRVIHSGSHEDLIESSEKYRTFVEMQFLDATNLKVA